MKLPGDAHLLYSLVNMKLRNDYDDLDDLLRSLDVDGDELAHRLAAAGYVYDAALNRFRPVVSQGRIASPPRNA